MTPKRRHDHYPRHSNDWCPINSCGLSRFSWLACPLPPTANFAMVCAKFKIPPLLKNRLEVSGGKKRGRAEGVQNSERQPGLTMPFEDLRPGSDEMHRNAHAPIDRSKRQTYYLLRLAMLAGEYYRERMCHDSTWGRCGCLACQYVLFLPFHPGL
jgi:hypothetical protein